MSRKKREEERRILAELDEAVHAEKGENDQNAEEKPLRCPRCKSAMKKGVCPTCGHTVYIPMDEEKRKKIKGVLTVVCLVIFVAVFWIMKAKG